MAEPVEPSDAARGVDADLLDGLASLLSGETPRLLIVQGPPGSGKSSFLRALAGRLRGPTLYVAYRALGAASGAVPAAVENVEVSLLVLDPTIRPAAGASEPDFSSAVPVSFAPAGAQAKDGYPPALAKAIAGMVAAGGGCIVIDSWDRSTEETFRRAANVAGAGTELTSSVGVLRAQLGRLPVHTALALFSEPEAAMNSLADEVVSLGHEELDGAEMRVLSLTKSAIRAGFGPRMLFSVSGGEFYAPTPEERPEPSPPRPAEPEPSADAGRGWPGSTEYARAFGRLRHHGLSAIEVFDDTPDSAVDALVMPMIVSALSTGGRVVWVPAPSKYPARLIHAVSRAVSPELVRQSLRILSASGYDPALAEFSAVVLPNRRGPHEGGEVRAAVAPPVEPLFPEAYQFLRDRPGEGLSLFVLSSDGLRALSTVSGNVYDPSTFPVLVSRYERLSHFHGLGWAREGDPLVPSMLPGVDAHLRVHQRYGHTVIVGLRPRTPAYLLDWDRGDAPYSLVSLG